MKIYKTAPFEKWAKKEKVADSDLLSVVDEMQQGQVEASLGGKLYKKRVAISGRGKRGGARVIVAFVADDKSFFIYGFTKNEIENITNKQLDALKKLASHFFEYDQKMIRSALHDRKLYEVKSNE